MSIRNEEVEQLNDKKHIRKVFLVNVRSFFIKNEKEIVFFLALILLSVFSFEVGMMKGQGTSPGTLVIEKPIEQNVAQGSLEPSVNSLSSANAEAKVAGVETAVQNTEECMFVGSKNSDKYHSLTCHWAKRIKPENIVCFTSVEDAQGKGYIEGCIE